MSATSLPDVGPLRSALKGALGAAREKVGTRTVILAPDVSRGGNLLYMWAWAHTLRARHGEGAAVVERNRHADAWLAEFPDLLPLTIESSEIRLLDKRHTESLNYYADPMGDTELRSFVRERLLSSASFAARVERARERVGADALVINVRRGDYYANPAHARQYGMDIRAHVQEALVLLGVEGADGGEAFIVSDDPAWCQANLGDLVALREPFDGEEHSMFNDLAVLACASRLVLANSTFSYWGQFISRGVSGTQRVVAPAAHEVNLDTGRVIDLLFDPEWMRTHAGPGSCTA